MRGSEGNHLQRRISDSLHYTIACKAVSLYRLLLKQQNIAEKVYSRRGLRGCFFVFVFVFVFLP